MGTRQSFITRLLVVSTLSLFSQGFARADFVRHIYSLTSFGPLDMSLTPIDPFDRALGTLDTVDISLYGITAVQVYHPAFHPVYRPVGVYPLTLQHDLGGFGGNYFDFDMPLQVLNYPVVVNGPVAVLPPWYIDVRFSIDAQTTTILPSTFISTLPAGLLTISASLNDFYADAEPADDLLMHSFYALAPTLVIAQSQHLLQIDYHYTPAPDPVGPISPIDPITGLTGLTTDLTTQALFPNLMSIHDLSEDVLQALIATPVPVPGALLLAVLGLARLYL